eukprot:COSAG02_NODE_4496_length_5292_cov_16.155979_5_plen_38_part_00
MLALAKHDVVGFSLVRDPGAKKHTHGKMSYHLFRLAS